jgi:hypothetical protein
LRRLAAPPHDRKFDGRRDLVQAGRGYGRSCFPFELAAGELARIGIVLARLPGEYRVNFRAGGESTPRTVETLDEALAAGRALAAARAPAPANGGGPRRRRRLRMLPKAIRRRRIKRHNRRLRARAIRQQLAGDPPGDD